MTEGPRTKVRVTEVGPDDDETAEDVTDSVLEAIPEFWEAFTEHGYKGKSGLVSAAEDVHGLVGLTMNTPPFAVAPALATGVASQVAGARLPLARLWRAGARA